MNIIKINKLATAKIKGKKKLREQNDKNYYY